MLMTFLEACVNDDISTAVWYLKAGPETHLRFIIRRTINDMGFGLSQTLQPDIVQDKISEI
jgi:hypothetical protein